MEADEAAHKTPGLRQTASKFSCAVIYNISVQANRRDQLSAM